MFKTVKPFVKWAGGKSQLLCEIRKKYPEKIQSYCEPFVGGGAVLFDVLANFNPGQVIINDINPELINTYNFIKKSPEDVIKLLSQMQEKFWNMTTEERKDYFYSKRERFNNLISNCENSLEKAVLFIFLNKTCFNGLYRVNKKGLFNVPMGSYKNPLICDSENILAVSDLIQNATIKCGDYSSCEDFINENTFVYIDPPYRPLNDTSSFNSYAKEKFDDDEQIRLSEFVTRISYKGAKIVASNSDPKNIDETDDFFDDIYRNFTINRIKANRMINSKASNRGSIDELLICNY